MTYCHDERQDEVMDAVDDFVGQRVDALMGGAPEAAAAVRRIIEENIPVITYNNDVLGMNVDRVFVDNQNAATRAVSHLIDLGHTRIAHIAGRQDVSTGVARREGYVTALRRAGIDLEDALVEQGNWHVDGGYAASARLMHLECPPTAIFTANYLMAVGVLEGARDHGWSIPDTFSLVSFDDTQLFRFYPEGISAISQPVDEIAKSIVDTTLARLQGAEVAATTTSTIQCNLILRGSTRPPRLG